MEKILRFHFQNMNKKKTSLEICGYWVHITWNGDVGKDTQGNNWTNPENPTPENKILIDKLLDLYNDLKIKINKNVKKTNSSRMVRRNLSNSRN